MRRGTADLRLLAVTGLMLIMLVACAAPEPPVASASTDRELELRPGDFPVFDDIELGDPVEFSNDIYSARCHPLFEVTGWSHTGPARRSTGRIFLWINRAHVVEDRVFVETCEAAFPFAASDDRIEGYLSDVWHEATLAGEPGVQRINLQSLGIAEWTAFSNPSLCGSHVAFWHVSPTSREGTAHVVNLFDVRERTSTGFGPIAETHSDMGWGLPRARWLEDCSEATFQPEDKTAQTLRVAIRR